MKNITVQEFRTLLDAAKTQLDAHELSPNCENHRRASTAAKIYSSLTALYSKVYTKGEIHIATGKVARCMAKHIQSNQDRDLFENPWDSVGFLPILEEHLPE